MKVENIDIETKVLIPIHLILKLKRPICFIDFESTGLDKENDRIVQLSICKLYPDGKEEIKTKYINPQHPMSKDAFELHGITEDKYINEPTFKQLAKGIHNFISDSDIAGYNSNIFDLPLLYFEFTRAGIIWDYHQSNLIDIANIFKIQEPRTLTAAQQFYCGIGTLESHDAENDILVTKEVFEAQLNRYENIPLDVQELALFTNYGKELIDITGRFTKDDDNDLIFNFGANKGKKCKNEKNYLDWIVNKSSFNEDVKNIASNILKNIEK